MNSAEIQHTCPICSLEVGTWRKKAAADGIIYNIDYCQSCDFAFVNPRPTMAFLLNFYASFGDGPCSRPDDVDDVLRREAEFPNSTLDAERLITTIQRLCGAVTGKKFLDVGCGYGFFSREASHTGFDVSALELSEHERSICRALARIVPTPSSFEDYVCQSGSLSAILMSQILEHSFDINLWIQKAHTLLEKDGILAIALPNYGSLFRLLMQENEPYICPPAHLNFFTKKSLSKILNKNGFNIEAVQWVSRISPKALVSRTPIAAKQFLPFIKLASAVSLKTIDAMHLGMMISVYGRKI